MAAEVLALHIAGLIEDGANDREPSMIDALAGGTASRNAVTFLVFHGTEASGGENHYDKLRRPPSCLPC